MGRLLGHAHPERALLAALDVAVADIADEHKEEQHADLHERGEGNAADQARVAVVDMVLGRDPEL